MQLNQQHSELTKYSISLIGWYSQQAILENWETVHVAQSANYPIKL